MPHFKGKALTLWRPWDLAIVFHGKNVENRKWATNYTGPLAIHSGQRWDNDGYLFCADRVGTTEAKIQLATDAHKGHIIGVCELYACHKYLNYKQSPQAIRRQAVKDNNPFADYLFHNPWAFGPYCWLLRKIQAIEPIPMRGRQRLWNVEFEYKIR
jgi:hypothetical protein